MTKLVCTAERIYYACWLVCQVVILTPFFAYLCFHFVHTFRVFPLDLFSLQVFVREEEYCCFNIVCVFSGRSTLWLFFFRLIFLELGSFFSHIFSHLVIRGEISVFFLLLYVWFFSSLKSVFLFFFFYMNSHYNDDVDDDVDDGVDDNVGYLTSSMNKWPDK